ncbi:MAG: glycosyltransferase family 4 protein [Gemmataceae bacterium]
MRPSVHILTPTLSPFDAVSNDVLGMARWLRRQGWQAEAYAEHLDERLFPYVRPLAEYRRHLRDRQDVLIYHHSVGWEAGLRCYERSRNRKIIKYHSITPARYFTPYHPPYARSCQEGEYQTRRLLQGDPDVILADSQANVAELQRTGIDLTCCHIVPPFHRLPDLHGRTVNRDIFELATCRWTFLFVGRVAPNKGHIHLIRALARFHALYSADSQLIFVGYHDPKLREYQHELRREIRRHNLEQFVRFFDNVSSWDLYTLYVCSDIFWCASEHEGFCVPLVEALALGLPVVAYGNDAVRGTLGPSGKICDSPRPDVLAAAAAEVLADGAGRRQLIDDQRAHYREHYQLSVIEQQLRQALEPVLETCVHA